MKSVQERCINIKQEEISHFVNYRSRDDCTGRLCIMLWFSFFETFEYSKTPETRSAYCLNILPMLCIEAKN